MDHLVKSILVKANVVGIKERKRIAVLPDRESSQGWTIEVDPINNEIFLTQPFWIAKYSIKIKSERDGCVSYQGSKESYPQNPLAPRTTYTSSKFDSYERLESRFFEMGKKIPNIGDLWSCLGPLID